MPTCPICQTFSHTRRAHVSHLSQSHPAIHAHNIATSRRGQPLQRLVGRPQLYQPVASTVQSIKHPSPPIVVLSEHRSLTCSVCFIHNGSRVFDVGSMALVSACELCLSHTYFDSTIADFCKHAPHLQRSRLYCPRGVCRYPHDSDGYDDRIVDWGCRGRVNNVYCQGHIPILCPTGPYWRDFHFSQVSLPLPSHSVNVTPPPPTPTTSPSSVPQLELTNTTSSSQSQ